MVPGDQIHPSWGQRTPPPLSVRQALGLKVQCNFELWFLVKMLRNQLIQMHFEIHDRCSEFGSDTAFHLQSAFQVGSCLGTSVKRVALGPGHRVRLPGRHACAGVSAPDTRPGRPTWVVRGHWPPVALRCAGGEIGALVAASCFPQGSEALHACAPPRPPPRRQLQVGHAAANQSQCRVLKN